MQLLFFVVFFFFSFLPIHLGVCALSAEAGTCTVYVQSAQRRHTQNLSPVAHHLVCLVIVALEMGTLGYEMCGCGHPQVCYLGLTWSSLLEMMKLAFGEYLSAGGRKSAMAAAREPGKDKEVCHQEGFRGA